MTTKQMLEQVIAQLAKAPSATVAIPGFGTVPTPQVARNAAKSAGETPASIVETVPYRRVRYSGRPSKAQIASLKEMGAFAHRVVGADGSQTWYWLVPTASQQ